MGFFLPDDTVYNLKYYKYQSEDRSIVSKYFLKPFWLRFCDIFPTWMAPNLVTLSGLGFMIFSVLLVLIYDPYLTSESPRWVYFVHAFDIFMYQTFDGCDGVHARRTGQSGPLGELFDHSIDSINTTLSVLLFSSMLNWGYGYLTLYNQFALLCNFYLSTWEEFHTHILFLSEFSGPVEGILGIVAAFIITGVFGPEIVWHTEVFTFTLRDGSIHIVDTAQIFLSFLTVGLLFNIFIARNNVITYYSNKNKILLNGRANIKEAMQGLIPFFLYYSSVGVLVLVDPKFISFQFILSVGLTMAFVVGRIIVHHLTKQAFPMVNFPMLLPFCQLTLYIIVVRILGHDSATAIDATTWLGLGISLAIHASFMNEIIFEFTDYLDVYALSIKHPKDI